MIITAPQVDQQMATPGLESQVRSLFNPNHCQHAGFLYLSHSRYIFDMIIKTCDSNSNSWIVDMSSFLSSCAFIFLKKGPVPNNKSANNF